MFETVHVVGAGRVGSALAARLAERGVSLTADGAEVVLLCVPDRAIPDVARRASEGCSERAAGQARERSNEVCSSRSSASGSPIVRCRRRVAERPSIKRLATWLS